MSRTRAVLLAFLLISLSVTPTLAGARLDAPTSPNAADAAQGDKGSKAAAEPRYASDHVVVKWKDGATTAASEKARGLSRVASVPGQSRAELVSSKGKSVEQLVAQLKGDPAVEWVEPDYIGKVDGPAAIATAAPTPAADSGQVEAVSVNDPYSARQYSLSQMDVRDAWSLSKGGNRLIAVIDTGVQWSHPDLAGQFAVNAAEKNGKPGVDDDGNGFVDDINGWDFVNNDNDPADDNNHGTWVSGVLAAQQNNGIGTAGITWTDQLLEVKVMAYNGYGFSSDVAAGIDYAVSRGAKIINLSIGGFADSYLMRAAVARAWNAGAVLVAAAG
ncbi:MAG TPA: S8 family serine peptidase, partial [Candidatus Limnocylindria bacterium]|nr:S8 family serine peptidase [Candidatus Limnocylindria bacterium]